MTNLWSCLWGISLIGLTKVGRRISTVDSTILWTKILAWIKRRKQAMQKHSLLSASWLLTQYDRLSHSPTTFPCQDGLHSFYILFKKAHMYHAVQVKVRRQSFLHHVGSGKWNQVSQTRQQIPLLTESSLRPYYNLLNCKPNKLSLF